MRSTRRKGQEEVGVGRSREKHTPVTTDGGRQIHPVLQDSHGKGQEITLCRVIEQDTPTNMLPSILHSVIPAWHMSGWSCFEVSLGGAKSRANGWNVGGLPERGHLLTTARSSLHHLLWTWMFLSGPNLKDIHMPNMPVGAK